MKFIDKINNKLAAKKIALKEENINEENVGQLEELMPSGAENALQVKEVKFYVDEDYIEAMKFVEIIKPELAAQRLLQLNGVVTTETEVSE